MQKSLNGYRIAHPTDELFGYKDAFRQLSRNRHDVEKRSAFDARIKRRQHMAQKSAPRLRCAELTVRNRGHTANVTESLRISRSRPS